MTKIFDTLVNNNNLLIDNNFNNKKSTRFNIRRDKPKSNTKKESSQTYERSTHMDRPRFQR